MCDQDDEIDWEELESRLYSQIYHAAPEWDEVISHDTTGMNTETIANKKYRYFVMPKAAPNQAPATLPSYIPLKNTTHKPDNFSIPTFQKHITDVESETRNTSSVASTHVHNNITVNQYTIPQLIVQSESVCSAEPLRVFSPWSAGGALNVIEKNKVGDKKNKRKQKLQIRFNRRKNKQQLLIEKRLQNSVTIFVDSDTSDDECVVVENETKNIVTKIHTGFPKKYDETNGDKKPEDDDEIIYIPPPPVEIINVDLEENEQISSAGEQATDKADCSLKNSQIHVVEGTETGENGQGVSSSESSTSNDFLDNICLQGTDFNNQQDFVRPPNPIEYCETESSGSTNEQGRDFCNTVKTIVFDEVDFPKDDIFSDNNLEGFGSFITPKRGNRNLEANSTPKIIEEAEPKHTEKEDSSSNGSSSESDYEEILNKSKSVDRNKNLPNLSLMMVTDTSEVGTKKNKTAIDFCCSTPKSKKGKSSETNEKTKLKKKQKRNKMVSENMIITNENMREIHTEEQQKGSDKEKKRKKKKHLSSGEGTPKNWKEKKRKSLTSDDQSLPESISSPVGKTKKKKTNINTSNNQDDNLEEKSESMMNSEEKSESMMNSEENNFYNTSQSVHSSTSEIIQTTTSEVVELTTNIPEKDSKDSENQPPIYELNVPDMIVIDETFGEEVVEIIPSESESDNDFQILDDVGDDMKLANCSAQLKSCNEISSGSSNAPCHTLPIDSATDLINFDVENIQKEQSDDPEKWQISYKDRALYLNMDKTRGPRCNRCRHFGHIAIKCTEKPNAPSCTLCGEPNHQEPRCPNKRCTQCGNRGNYSTSYCWKCFKYRHVHCKLCNMKGHIESSCPDLWRRYHSTTKEGPIVMPRRSLLTWQQRWCSGCARQGHLEHECDYYNREYPPTTPFIVEYEDVLTPHSDDRAVIPVPAAPPQLPAPNGETSSLLGDPNLLPLVNLLPLPVTNSLIPNQGQVPNPFALNSLLGQVQLPFGGSQEPVADFVWTGNGAQAATVENQNQAARMGHNFTANIPNENVIAVSRDFELKKTHSIGGAEIDLMDITKIKHLIMSAKGDIVHEFISKEMDELYNNVANCDLKLLRRKIFKYDKMFTRVTREKRFWFRILNMVVFGIRGLWDGRINSHLLKSFVSKTKIGSLYTEKRKSLFSAYCYIFGHEKRNLNYYKVMQLMIRNNDEGKLKKLTYCR